MSVDTVRISKSEQAYQAIKTKINDGSFGPGYRLVFGVIAKDLGFSTVPVREAVRRLEAEGLVNFEHNVGAQVAAIDPTEYLYTMQTLSAVEGFATGLAAPFLLGEDIAQARAVNEQMRSCLLHFDPFRFTALNLEFHSVLFERCTNPHILDLVHRGWNRLNNIRASTFNFVPGRAHESVEEHEQLLQLIEERASAEQVEHFARTHRTNTLDAFLAHNPLAQNPLAKD